jgi:hypothetical protein
MIHNFWNNLYKAREGLEKEKGKEEEREWFKEEGWKKLKEKIEKFDKLKEITHIISREEIREIVRNLKNGKAPGPDEITNEQIKKGPELLWEMLRRRYNQILKNKKIPRKWKKINIFMIHKKEETNDPDKYRGITLSSVVYKIMTKIIAKRLMERVTEGKIIDEAQGVGKMEEASYNEARTLHNIIEDANQFNKRVEIGYIDLTKAYDMVETWALDEVLKKMGLPKDFRELMSDINTGTEVAIITDFGVTERFISTRGVRQGCPLSPVLFCMFLEPLIRWIRNEEEGYRFKNDEELKIEILAYMDDIAIIERDRKEMKKMLEKIEIFCNTYGMEVSEKSVYTSNREKEEMKIQEITIEEYKKERAYKYLGFWTAADGNWKKHKEEAKKIHQSTVNLLSGGSIDPRIKGKLINIVVNTPLEYGFHSVPYTKEEIEEINIKNKKLLKGMMKISIRCPTSLLKMEVRKGGMGWRDLWDLYCEINIGDLGNVMNFQKEESLYHRTTIQRITDIKKELKIDLERNNKITKEQYNNYWGARVSRLIQKEGMNVQVNKRESWEFSRETRIEEIQEMGEVEGIREKE